MFGQRVTANPPRPATIQNLNPQQIVEGMYELEKSQSKSCELEGQKYKKRVQYVAQNLAKLNEGANSDGSGLTAKSQEALVFLIMSFKDDGCIVQKDILNVLEYLAKENPNLTKLTRACAQPEKVKHLLDSGALLYEAKTGIKIWLQTVEFNLPRDIELLVVSDLSIREQLDWAATSREHHKVVEHHYGLFLDNRNPELAIAREQKKSDLYTFFNNVEYRTDKSTPQGDRGREYLRSLGIGGPATCQAIISGELTIQDALKNRDIALEAVAKKLSNLPQTESTKKLHDALESALIKNEPIPFPYGSVFSYFIDGLMTEDQLIQTKSTKWDYLTRTFCEYINKHQFSVERFLALGLVEVWNAEVLKKPSVKKYIANDKLSVEDALKLSREKLANLDNKLNQKQIDSGNKTLTDAIKPVTRKASMFG